MAAETATKGPRWRRPGRWPLRAKLIGSMVTLLALVCLVVGVASEFALSAFLTDQIDGQLNSATGRARDFANRPPDFGDRHNPLDAPGQAAGTLNAQFVGGQALDAATLSANGVPQVLDASQQATLLQVPVDGKPYTRNLGGDLGDYRLTAVLVDHGIVVTGLPLKSAEDTLLTVGLILGGVASAGVLGAGFLGAFAIRRTLRPLERVAATAAHVVELPLDRGDVALSVRVPAADTDPGTEVGQVGAALNLMLGHIARALEARQASETRVRQFVADASHELRTPLAAIRGYAELTRRSHDRVPPGIAHSMSRIESEAARMTTLVEDLLLLARLDAGRPLEGADVDLTALVVDAVSDAHVAGPDHRWRLELADEPVIVPGDAQRLHQILANLLSNGRIHTPPGTTVTASLARSSTGQAVLTITDDGPGITRDLLPVVFERFARGDSSRSRAAGSTGLGMAIVSAVVIAHHGTVEVTSRPGRTEFEVRLPSAQPTHSVATRIPQVSR
ncbi:HAMP domain-containing sensor histidine kinase [Amycolatopsis sp.]|uniref:sensor histidine kinase n=1 Tax=Amycolatopsis sp. TaxID=37632 RepID=UPI002E0CF874|nr:HAMP domain-containing sensor histidine kinase [Amycolatopsis sp.]